MKNYKVMLIVVVAISLLAGTALGFWGGETYLRHNFHRSRSNGNYLKTRLLDRLDEMLELNEDQQASISAILENGVNEHKKVMEDFQNKMQALRNKRADEIEKVLTDEQRQKFASWKEKRHHKMRKGRDRYMKGGVEHEKGQ